MRRSKRRFDFSDLIILFGFSAFSYGLFEKFGLADMLIVSGGIMVLTGLYIARAGVKKAA